MDPDGREITFDNIKELAILSIQLAKNDIDNRNRTARNISNLMNENPDLWSVVAGAAAIGVSGELVYKHNEKANAFVNSSLEKIKQFDAMLKSYGVDIANMSYSKRIDTGYNLNIKLNPGNKSLTTTNILSYPITDGEISLKGVIDVSITGKADPIVNLEKPLLKISLDVRKKL